MDTIRLAVSRAGGVTLDRELGDHDTELAPGGSDGPLAVRVCGVEMGMVGGLQAQVAAGYITTHIVIISFNHFHIMIYHISYLFISSGSSTIC